MFAKIKDGVIHKFPYTVGQLRHDNPNTSFPKHISNAVMAEYGMVPVTEQPAPSFDPLTHFAEWGPVPVNQGGQWVLLPTVRELSPEQIAERASEAAASVREQRNRLLAETDYLALTDNTLDDITMAYRQALRDITSHVNFPYLTDADWPVKP